MTTVVDLPDDMLFQIFLRLLRRDVLSARGACPIFHRVISSNCFISCHKSLRRLLGFYCTTETSRPPRFFPTSRSPSLLASVPYDCLSLASFPMSGFELVDISGEFLLMCKFRKGRSDTLLVCNPAQNFCKLIPRPYEDWMSECDIGLGIISVRIYSFTVLSMWTSDDSRLLVYVFQGTSRAQKEFNEWGSTGVWQLGEFVPKKYRSFPHDFVGSFYIQGQSLMYFRSGVNRLLVYHMKRDSYRFFKLQQQENAIAQTHVGESEGRIRCISPSSSKLLVWELSGEYPWFYWMPMHSIKWADLDLPHSYVPIPFSLHFSSKDVIYLRLEGQNSDLVFAIHLKELKTACLFGLNEVTSFYQIFPFELKKKLNNG